MNENQNQPAVDNFGKLAGLLGFDPTKENPNKSVLEKALAKITEERDKALQVKVEEQLKKAIDLAQQKKKLDSEYKSQSAKWDKELGKLLNKLVAIQQDREPPVEPEEKNEQQ